MHLIVSGTLRPTWSRDGKNPQEPARAAEWEKLNMDTGEDPRPVICTFCGEDFTLTGRRFTRILILSVFCNK